MKTKRQAGRGSAVILCLLAGILAGMSGMSGMSGCARQDKRPTPAVTVLVTMLGEAGQRWPSGMTYSLTAPAEEDEHLTPTLLSALYGAAARRWLEGDEPPVCDAALFLSEVQHPAELAVFRCATAEAAGAVAAVGRARLDTLTRHWNGGEYAAWLTSANVTVKDTYVLLVVSDDPAPLVRAALSAIAAGG